MNSSAVKESFLNLLDKKKHQEVINGERPLFSAADAIEQDAKESLIEFESLVKELSKEELIYLTKDLFLRSTILLSVGSGINVRKAKSINEITSTIISRIKNSQNKSHLRIVKNA